MKEEDTPKEILEGYVCNNVNCRTSGRAIYFSDLGNCSHCGEANIPECKCPACGEDRTAISTTEYVEPEYDAKDVLPTILIGGSSAKGRAYYTKKS
jgi:ribosomal protein L32